MTIQAPIHLERCGLAARTDLERPAHQRLLAALAREQADFLARETDFRSPAYPWPRDALHNWSRVWEYPYVYHQVQRWRTQQPAGLRPLLVDVGCGVTFLPFALARLGCRVVGADIDPICQHDLSRAAAAVPAHPGTVEARLIENGRLPLADGEADGVLCVSVLEHIPNYEGSLAEMARVLKPGGLLVVTLDMSWREDHALAPSAYRRLRTALESHFELTQPEPSVHPADLLRSDFGPYRLRGSRGPGLLPFLIKQHVIKPLLGRKPRARTPLLSVWAGVARRKERSGA